MPLSAWNWHIFRAPEVISLYVWWNYIYHPLDTQLKLCGGSTWPQGDIIRKLEASTICSYATGICLMSLELIINYNETSVWVIDLTPIYFNVCFRLLLFTQRHNRSPYHISLFLFTYISTWQKIKICSIRTLSQFTLHKNFDTLLHLLLSTTELFKFSRCHIRISCGQIKFFYIT